MKRTSILIAIALLIGSTLNASDRFKPTKTLKFATRDSIDLYLDIYEPAGSTTLNGKNKPTILFVFGGGFITGTRNDRSYDWWFKHLVNNGYRVVANDYRLGLKGMKKMGVAQAKYLGIAVDMAVEDLFSATAYLCENAEELGIDPSNIVVSGSSAGAITSLQAEWYICNSHPLCSILPEGFNYSGLMSFAGAIYSDKGGIRYKKEPCPMLLFHGKDDRIVNYNQIWFFNLRFAGSNVISRTLKREDRNYQIFRFDGYGHEIAGVMNREFLKEIDFLQNNVMQKKKIVIDASVKDDGIVHYKDFSKLSDLYGNPENHK